MKRVIVCLLACGLAVLAGCYANPWEGRLCLHHDFEPPFELDPDRPPGPGLVFATADFSGSGSVLLKVQVEDLGTVAGEEASVTVWSGNGTAPANAGTLPPPGGTEVYATSGDVTLRHWTTHLDRTYDPSQDAYWLFVRVDHDTGGGTRNVRHLWWYWQPSTSASPDTPHDFNQY
ncbi:MAG: hypothetical protein ACYTG2_14070 [Planctomycetota bacterium]|jgi:hypothetical protein